MNGIMSTTITPRGELGVARGDHHAQEAAERVADDGGRCSPVSRM
jgi:hypothetical protein